MKIPFILVLLALLVSCQASKEDTVRNEMKIRFDSSWNLESQEEIAALRSSLAKSPVRNEYSLYCRSWLQARNGDYKKAIVTADSLVMGFPAFDQGWYLRANLRSETRDQEGAMRDFDRVIKKNPGFYEALINRGNLHFQTQHPDLALKDFMAAKALKPGNAQALLNIANCWLALGKADSACFYLSKAEQSGNPKATGLINRFCTDSAR